MRTGETSENVGLDDIEKVEEEGYEFYDKIRYKLIRLSIIFSIIVFNWDPFLCYKRGNKQLRDRFYRLPELRVRQNYMDRLRKICTKYFFGFLAYIVIKYLILASALSIIHTSKRSSLANHSRNFHDIVDIAHKTNLFFGNFLDSTGDTASFIFIFLPLCILHSIFYTSWSFNHEPIDALYLRLGISPIPEIKRIDLVIVEMLDSIEITVNNLLYKISKLNDPKFNDYYQKQSIQWARDELLNLVDIISDLRLTKASMRPAVYNAEYLRKMFDIILYFALVIIIICHPWVSYYPLDLYRYGRRLTCEEKFQTTNELLCQQLNPPTKRNLMMLIELALVIYLVGYMMGMLTFQILANVKIQLKSIHNMNEDLDDCLISLKKANQTDSMIDNHGEQNGESNYGKLSIGIERKLLKTWIKLRITDDETQRNFSFVSRILSVYLSTIIYSITLMLFFSTNSKDSTPLALYRYLLFGTQWGLFNFVSLACSASYTNAKQVEKKAWSVLAQMYIRACRLNVPFHRGFLAIHWIKLVRSRRLSMNGKTVRFLNLFGITYQSVLQMNFVLVSLYSILKTST